MKYQRIISPSLSPNTEAEDVREALRVILNPSTWQQGSAIGEVEDWFNGVSFDSGRSALFAILRAFDVGEGDEVLFQAFTCDAVPRSVLMNKAIPVSVDIDTSFNIDPVDAERKITKKTKAVIVQHTFGVPAHMDAIFDFAKKYGIIIIEDCAHSLGATYKGKKVGTFGDAAFFSFGRDKVISSVWGGMATISQKSKVKSQKLRQFQEKLSYPSRGWIAQQLSHPVAFAAILPTYTMVIGKILLEGLKRLHLLSLPLSDMVPRRYPNALAQLLIKQLAKLDRYNEKRRRIASFYHDALKSGTLHKGAIYVRYPYLVENPEKIIKKAKRRGILLGNWYNKIIDPKGSCPRAQEAVGRIVNLPTLVSYAQAKKVVCSITGSTGLLSP